MTPAGAETQTRHGLFLEASMYIQNDNTDTQRLHDADHMDDDYVVEFNDNGVAQVREEVGTALVESDDHPTISEYDGGEN